MIKSMAEQYTCKDCGMTYNRRPYLRLNCSCQRHREPWSDAEAERLNLAQCMRIADHERMKTRNVPMSESDVESLLEFDALYEDDAAWNRRSRKCTADGIPEECRDGNPEGRHRSYGDKAVYHVNPRDFDAPEATGTCLGCGVELGKLSIGRGQTECNRCQYKISRKSSAKR